MFAWHSSHPLCALLNGSYRLGLQLIARRLEVDRVPGLAKTRNVASNPREFRREARLTGVERRASAGEPVLFFQEPALLQRPPKAHARTIEHYPTVAFRNT